VPCYATPFVTFEKPLLKKVQTNLYKCFITQAWTIGSAHGIAGFLHPEGGYDDPKGGRLRAALYPRLRHHYQFINEAHLFAEVHNLAKFSVNVYACDSTSGNGFSHACNLFHPATIDGSHVHDGAGTVPGIKNDDDHWDMRPHSSRLITVNRDRLLLFAQLYDETGTPPEQARLPVIHSEEIVKVLEKFAAQPRKLGSLDGEYYTTEMWHETADQKEGTIRRETRFPNNTTEWIVSGPHIYVGTPFNKTPNEGCSTNRDYSDIDLTAIQDDYLPRTNYVPACTLEEYRRRTPKFKGKEVTNYYRLGFRNMIGPNNERTLIGGLIPREVGHIHGVKSFCFSNEWGMCLFAGMIFSIPLDFFVKSTGKANLQELPSLLPWLDNRTLITEAIVDRALRLNCLTRHYASLWESLTATPWHRSCALRTDQNRRQALVELDALAALALELTEEELITIYRVQFPVLRQYERENLYDQTGRFVPKGVLDLARRHNIDTRQPLKVSAFTGPAELVGEVETPGLGITGGIVWEDPKMEPKMKRVYPPPFTKCDREADMRQAYRAFQERLRSQEDAP
jgi:hypothetical protein